VRKEERVTVGKEERVAVRKEERGGRVEIGVRAMKFLAEGGDIKEILLEDGRRISADRFILCIGPWTRDFLALHGVYLPVMVIRCPAYRFKVEGMFPAFSDEENDSYWRPGRSGTLVGGGYQAEILEDLEKAFGNPPKRFRIEAERLLKLRVKGDTRIVDEWTGPCSVTPDLNPIVGRVPDFSNLYIVDGLRGYGLMRGPALGYGVADLTLGEKRRDLEKYSLLRFSQDSV